MLDDVAPAVTPALLETGAEALRSELDVCIDELWVQLRFHTYLIDNLLHYFLPANTKWTKSKHAALF